MKIVLTILRLKLTCIQVPSGFSQQREAEVKGFGILFDVSLAGLGWWKFHATSDFCHRTFSEGGWKSICFSKKYDPLYYNIYIYITSYNLYNLYMYIYNYDPLMDLKGFSNPKVVNTFGWTWKIIFFSRSVFLFFLNWKHMKKITVFIIATRGWDEFSQFKMVLEWMVYWQNRLICSTLQLDIDTKHPPWM